MNKLLLLAGIAVLAAGCSQVNKRLGLQDDNIVEETAEFVIKEETGLDIDLTPSSPETK